MSNCYCMVVYNGTGNSVQLFSKRNIEQGEELLFDYNFKKE